MAGKRTPQKRERKEKTPEQKIRAKRRAKTGRHVITLEADLTEQQKRIVLSIMGTLGYIARKIANLYRKRLDNLHQRKDYRKLLDDRRKLKAKLDRIGEEHDDYEELSEALKEIEAELESIRVLEGVVPDDGRELASYIASQHKHVHSVFALSVFEDVWKAVEQNLFGNGKKLSGGDFLHSIRTKQSNRGITIKAKNGKLVFSHKDGIGAFGIVEPDEDDLFLREEIAAVVAFLSDKDAEDKADAHLLETGELLDTFRPCYVTLKAEEIRGKWRIWCLLTVEGEPKPKRKRDGSPRHCWPDEGDMGFDIGPSTYAACAEDFVEMKNLAERNNRSTGKDDAKINRLRRAMDRSRRATNPQNYNENGTIKRGRKEWIYSKGYKRKRREVAEAERKAAASRKYAVQEDVNRLRSHGSIAISEKQSIAGWAKKAKKGTTRTNKKTGKKRLACRARMGRSVGRHCPGLFRAELKKKFTEYHEVDLMFRASQYDHETDSYVKKSLSQRTHYHQHGRASPRDAYSSFLLWCSDDEYKRVDRALCIKRFEGYYAKVQEMMARYKEEGVRVLNSGF